MLGTEPDKPTILLIDNQAMVANITFSSRFLKKKHNAIAYHKMREAVAAGIIKVAYIKTDQNKADILNEPIGPRLYNKLFYFISFKQKPKKELKQPGGTLSKILIKAKQTFK